MNSAFLEKIFNVLIKRPNRLLKKDTFLRLRRAFLSTLVLQKLPDASRPRLYFDVTLLSILDNKTGVHRVIRSVFEEIKPLIEDNYDLTPVSCNAFTEGFYALTEINGKGRKCFKLSPFKIDPKDGDIFLSLEQAFVEHLAQKRVFSEMKQKGCRVILTVYDLLPIQLPYCFPVETKSIFENWLLSSTDYAEFLCDSKTVKTDLANFLSSKNKHNELFWFYPGSNFVKDVSSSGISKEQTNYLRTLNEFSFNFLMVGTIEPRKGHKVIFNLFNRLWKEHNLNASLTFIGKEGWLVNDVVKILKKSTYLNKNFFWFENASDEFLERCYSVTDAVIVASLNEGFGLPLLEAANHNCRVIANDIGIFREVAPKECYFLELSNPDKAILQLLNWMDSPSKTCTSVTIQDWKQSTIQLLKATKII